MMRYYYPSCKFKIAFPEISEKIIKYLNKKSIETKGCCRIDHRQLNEIDTGITICTNCSLILKEVSKAHIYSLWEIIDQDKNFLLPRLNNSTCIIQHCAKADDNIKKAVCSLIDKTGASYRISSHDDYCGFNFMQHMSSENLKIAPKTFSALEKKVVLLNEEQRREKITDLIKEYDGKQVIVYCNSCYKVLKENGANVIHIAELLF